MYYTYILLSLKDNKLYIGYSSNLKQRIKEHISGNVFATKSRLPLKLIFYEAFLSKDDALKRERYFKSDPGKKSLALLIRNSREEVFKVT